MRSYKKKYECSWDELPDCSQCGEAKGWAAFQLCSGCKSIFTRTTTELRQMYNLSGINLHSIRHSDFRTNEGYSGTSYFLPDLERHPIIIAQIAEKEQQEILKVAADRALQGLRDTRRLNLTEYLEKQVKGELLTKMLDSNAFEKYSNIARPDSDRTISLAVGKICIELDIPKIGTKKIQGKRVREMSSDDEIEESDSSATPNQLATPPNSSRKKHLANEAFDTPDFHLTTPTKASRRILRGAKRQINYFVTDDEDTDPVKNNLDSIPANLEASNIEQYYLIDREPAEVQVKIE